ncbi:MULTISPECIES: cytochrome c-type biogenesis protein [unclassified Marinobacterium]|jgi:cytochrome c-type biogenesis protein CcmH/NrfF|uniref:cytochrome c-type biogenesis protein n=1 Tax=unclassified Marinobacterium TaxID=2644139 RepID=UPI00156907E5|nr:MULTISPECIES: cytochrome c-type biogenesis protein [unclassified Marinobacterium]NRP09329.1 Cytochrome c-type biogenesis protein CcmH precursor [Marinobacterium sp. xm-g-48]NRP26677.1 Cytochrome c-type biogenesis protein CcmH precursor [Marinobacterium sp. xm-d-420]NRP37685.1 Cytochrome c-type biogenesis protein CcmH precursor [Marinobacterium sp. xm-a-121]NRP56492.1 Cytochrome c-type biogenesis protein CcmH precursor [Marinobacterium sp. xm-d-510]NRP82140.1 Cytochrome c-type biogenesis pro
MIRALFLLVLLSSSSFAAIDTHNFKSVEDEKRFHALAAELRCPKCQNQNIADSDSPIAKDLRTEVFRMIDEGAEDESIIDFMVTRYGEFVLYRPKMNSQTWLLWNGPFLVLGFGVLVILAVVWQRRSRRKVSEAALSSDDQARLDALLKQDKE